MPLYIMHKLNELYFLLPLLNVPAHVPSVPLVNCQRCVGSKTVKSASLNPSPSWGFSANSIINIGTLGKRGCAFPSSDWFLVGKMNERSVKMLVSLCIHVYIFLISCMVSPLTSSDA